MAELHLAVLKRQWGLCTQLFTQGSGAVQTFEYWRALALMKDLFCSQAAAILAALERIPELEYELALAHGAADHHAAEAARHEDEATGALDDYMALRRELPRALYMTPLGEVMGHGVMEADVPVIAALLRSGETESAMRSEG